MKILVVGGGGREHALCWKLAMGRDVEAVICAPGNGGIGDVARCEPVAPDDLDGQVALARREQVDLVVVGPEVPLVAGLSDRLQAEGIPVFGPSAKAAMLEGSKTFSKEFMMRHQVPTASFSVHTELSDALAAIEKRGGPCVVKADGLAAGKGVLLCRTSAEARSAVTSVLGQKAFGEAGAQVVIEDFLSGEEASVLAICDGTEFVTLVAAQDHKAAFDGDNGPNTGGMGAYVPAPVVTPALQRRIEEQVIAPTVAGMAAEGMPFIGILYAGMMIDGDDIKVLEFNVRFGDPECQPLLALMKTDLAPVLLRAATGALKGTDVEWYDGAALCVVLAAGGYPGDYDKGAVITGLDDASAMADVVVFHAGTQQKNDRVVTNGGRVLGVTGVGTDLTTAARTTYAACDCIAFEGMRMRRDIGHRAL